MVAVFIWDKCKENAGAKEKQLSEDCKPCPYKDTRMQGYPYAHRIAIEWGGGLLRDTLAVTMKNKHDRVTAVRAERLEIV